MKFIVLIGIFFLAACSNTVTNDQDTDFIEDCDFIETDAETVDEDEISICEELEAVLQKHINTEGESGKAIGLIVRMESPDVSETCTFGSKVKDAEVKPTGDEQWVIGSVSKMLTSFILTQKAVDDGKILEDPAENYLPENWSVPSGSGGKKFTMINLMTHTSGLPHYPKTLQESIDNVGSLEDMYAAWEDYTINDLESDLSKTTLSFDPGTEYQYSDFGFALVQKAGEMLYEKTFPEMLAEFSELLGLENTVVPENLS